MNTNFFKKILLSIVIVPVTNTGIFLDLKYSDIKPNVVTIQDDLTFKVNNSASPFFIKMEQTEKIKNIEVEGRVNIKKAITQKGDDSYFQLGVIYAGDYRPGGFIKTFLPEWLTIVLSLSEKEGVGEIDFFAVSEPGSKVDRKESIRSINLNFKTEGFINKSDGSFKFSFSPKDKKILGLWLRVDGDDSKAEFETRITKLSIN